MTIIRYVLPENDHALQKLALLYWEVADLHDAEKKLRPEMILACNYIMRDIEHPNEYVRGSTLRFLSKVKDQQMLESLTPAVLKNLTDRHAYVRRYAVIALHSIFLSCPQLVPNAPDLIYDFVQDESDASCKRHALVMLFDCDPEKGIRYLKGILSQLDNFGEVMQSVVVELLRKACKTHPGDKSTYLRATFSLMKSSSSPSVRFEAAGTLLALTNVPSSIKEACATYIDLLVNEADTNVKLVILSQLEGLKQRYASMMRDLVMDLVRALQCPTIEIRRRTLDLVSALTTAGNVEGVLQCLKKELAATQNKKQDKTAEYRQALIRTLHQIAVRFDVAASVVHVLIDCVGDAATTTQSACDIMAFAKEVAESYPELRKSILTKLLVSFPLIKSSKVYRIALWIIADIVSDEKDLALAFATIKTALGSIPDYASSSADGAAGASESGEQPVDEPQSVKPSNGSVRVLADGTYASQTAVQAPVGSDADEDPTQAAASLQSLLNDGDNFLATVISSALTKLCLKCEEYTAISKTTLNSFKAEVIFIIVRIIMLLRKDNHNDPDAEERMKILINVVRSSSKVVRSAMLGECHESYQAILKEMQQEKKDANAEEKTTVVQADDLIKIPLFTKSKDSELDAFDEDADLVRATGKGKDSALDDTRLHRIVQLSGFSDPLYVEGVVTISQYDVLLEFSVLNQTSSTLQNIALELITVGDLKVAEKPQSITIPPGETGTMKAVIRVTSTDSSLIHANMTYEVVGAAVTKSQADTNCVALREIKLDIMDYIEPAACSENKFRQMWIEFEWENKITVSTAETDVLRYLGAVLDATKMKCLTPPGSVEDQCSFVTANLYARSIFGEDVLANVSVESEGGSQVTGLVRIRAKTQGIALAIGEKIQQAQKALKPLPAVKEKEEKTQENEKPAAANEQ